MDKQHSSPSAMRRLGTLMRKRDRVGGLACAKGLLDSYDVDYSHKKIDDEFAPLLVECGLKSLMGVLKEHGVGSRALHCDRRDLAQIRVPAILYWDLNRFVLLKGVSARAGKTEYIVFDPQAREHKVFDCARLDEHYSEVLVEGTGLTNKS